MVTRRQRLQFVNDFLNAFGRFKSLAANSRNERVFELFCYFRKAHELVSRGKTIIPQKVKGRSFVPHSKPGNPLSASYISLLEPYCETFDLFLNGEFQGRSGVRHSPDIVLREKNSEKILSIYECKLHSGKLELPYYREFIGYLEEMRIPKRRHSVLSRNLYPELRSCIFTSAKARALHNPIRNLYDFDVIDKL